MPKLISDDTRRTPPAATEPHYHVWIVRDFAMFAKRDRFRTRQTARTAALRAGMEPGEFIVRKCDLPCVFKRPRKYGRRKRRTSGQDQKSPVGRRRRCAHCGRLS